MKQTVAIFADVQNIYYTVRERYNRHFNYTALWQHVTNNRQLNKAIAYAIDRGDNKQKGFQQILQNIGFEIKLKPFIQRSDGSAKGDWDVGITLDMIEFGAKANVVVLLSGDGDFDLVVEKLRNKYQVEVEVFGVQELTAASLVKAASKFTPITDTFLLS